MLWSVFAHLVAMLLDLLAVRRQAEGAQDLEIVVLRLQLRLLQRRASRSPRLSRWEKLTLAVRTATLPPLAVRFTTCSGYFGHPPRSASNAMP